MIHQRRRINRSVRRDAYRIIGLWATFILMGCQPALGPLIDTKEVRGDVEIRIQQFQEKSSFILADYYYVYQSRSGSKDWQQFLIVRHDDPDPIPTGQVVFPVSKAAAVYMDNMYAVTVDAGEAWTVFDVRRTSLGHNCRSTAWGITEVAVFPSGVGHMKVSFYPPDQSCPDTLQTNDYGKTWTVQR
jgi:hypothetical protein